MFSLYIKKIIAKLFHNKLNWESAHQTIFGTMYCTLFELAALVGIPSNRAQCEYQQNCAFRKQKGHILPWMYIPPVRLTRGKYAAVKKCWFPFHLSFCRLFYIALYLFSLLCILTFKGERFVKLTAFYSVFCLPSKSRIKAGIRYYIKTKY